MLETEFHLRRIKLFLADESATDIIQWPLIVILVTLISFSLCSLFPKSSCYALLYKKTALMNTVWTKCLISLDVENDKWNFLHVFDKQIVQACKSKSKNVIMTNFNNTCMTMTLSLVWKKKIKRILSTFIERERWAEIDARASFSSVWNIPIEF